jgi:glycosyltransferase involved in cell wall biosynthesis
MKIAILSGAFPPQFDGIGDHTWRLSQELSAQGQEVTVFTSLGPARPKPLGVDVICCFDPGKPETIQKLPRALRAAGRFDYVLLQYNPFSFGPRGFAPWLVYALARAKIPLVLMLHETYVPLWPWRFSLMRLWQYPQFVCLVRAACALLVSTVRWLPQLRRWTKRRCTILPVGSNLPAPQMSKPEARAKLGLAPDVLLLGIFGFGHISKRTEWVGAAARRIYQRFPKTQLLNVGQTSDSLPLLCAPVPVHQHGLLSGHEASLRLRAMDLFLAPFADGISPRRGSVIAALQHGVPVCSTFREYTDRFLLDFVSPAFSLTPSSDESCFTRGALNMAEKSVEKPQLGEDLVKFHDRYFAWPVIAQDLINELRLPSRDSVPKIQGLER